ncbi:GIY-YIG nuclease family protein [Candidatus Pelagibacter bacterium nBUS_27]|uniref:GIY-YIG nuclease family protein n=1 Tax=Candidatus Pelagibacter bacterium nBUS_27 TaxID=3374188 RepID=UPI003EB88D49
MAFYVYMLKSISPGSNKTYVGYTNNIKQRLLKHNSNKGAKSTMGYFWIVIYKRYFKNKNEAMSYEYKLKNDKKKRSKLSKNENLHTLTL